MNPQGQGETPRSPNELDDSWFNLRAQQVPASPRYDETGLDDPIADAWFIGQVTRPGR